MYPAFPVYLLNTKMTAVEGLESVRGSPLQ